MEERKDYYKNNFSQAEDRANNKEQEYRAEAEAFEKLRHEYNTNVVELENLEKDKAKSSISQREVEKITLQPWPKTTELSSWNGSVIHEVCVASDDRNYGDWKAWLAPCHLSISTNFAKICIVYVEIPSCSQAHRSR